MTTTNTSPSAPAPIPGPRYFDLVKVGETLPPLDIQVDATLIVAGALGSKDYVEVHHDPKAAQAQGAKDIFMNILTSNGLAGRYLGDWGGPGSLLRKISFRLGVPCYPGELLQFSGEVVEKLQQEPCVQIRIQARNSLGEHLSGTALMVLPVREQS